MAQDRITASPQSPALGALARYLRAARSLGDEARIPLIDMGLGELLLGKAPEEIEEWSYGNLPFQRGREGIGSRIPQLKRGRAEGFMDAMMGALDAAGVGVLARRGLTAAAGSAGTRFGANPIPQIGAIKPRGGNWLTGSVEGSLEELMPLPRGYSERVEVPDRGSVRYISRDPELGIREVREYLQEAAPQQEALQRWIEGPLTKYIKRDMATPEDPVRRLAEEGIVHYSPEIDTNSPTLRELRSSAGFPPEGLGRSAAARQWEAMSDMQPIVRMGRDFPDGIASFMDEETLADNPWLTKLGPGDNVYSLNKRYPPNQALGFDHLVDELSNAMDPGSGLPRNLLLRPEQMQQMGMEKAVRHVDAINKWRAAQEVAANQELANKAMVLREYPDTPELPNPRGLRWVELKKEDDVLPEDYSVVPDARNSRYWDRPDEHYFHVMSPSGEIVSTGATEKEALGLLNRDKKIKALENQLKYEGDTMGHCVGGYCPDVLEGRSRIFSLRDSKGEPHVTVEVEPPRKRQFDAHGDFEKLPPELQDQIIADYGAGAVGWARRVQEDPRVISWFEANTAPGSSSIRQIKGKQNQAPKDDYLPFVQDFVRNNPLGGSWADVGDLRNTGLRKVGNKYVTLDELKDVPRDGLGLPIGYQPLDDLPEWRDGGLVDEGIDDPVQFALQWRELVDAENGYRRA